MQWNRIPFQVTSIQRFKKPVALARPLGRCLVIHARLRAVILLALSTAVHIGGLWRVHLFPSIPFVGVTWEMSPLSDPEPPLTLPSSVRFEGTSSVGWGLTLT